MTMHCASIHRPAGQWPKEKATGTLTLDFDGRHRRRNRLTADQGEGVLLDLPKAVAMADGDGLQLEDGQWLKVRAATELVAEVRHKDPNQLVRLAWHLGNRHFAD
jgi:urease accessory protein